jgi:hypothetical protein
MKALLTILIAFTLASCKKEYECTQTLNQSKLDLNKGTVTKVTYQWFSTFKGSRKEMIEHEKIHTFNTNESDGNLYFTLGTCVMKCK